MKIENNILAEGLKNVLFISGGAYGGKTTMAKKLQQKYGFVRYREGDMWDKHITYAQPSSQPAMCHDRSLDWSGFYNQPADRYHQWLDATVREEAEMAIIDLIKLSHSQRIVADVLIPPDMLKEIAGCRQVVLLFAPVEMKRAHYFDREDKRHVLNHIMSMPNPEKTLENVLDALTYEGEKEIQAFYNSGFKCIMRSPDRSVDETFNEIERHFGLLS